MYNGLEVLDKMNLFLGLLVLFLLTLISAFLNSAEIAMASMSRIRLQLLIKEHQEPDRQRRALQLLLEDPNRMIMAITLAMNFVAFVASSVATVLTVRLFHGLNDSQVVMASALFMTVYFILFGELTPKNVGKDNAARFTLRFIQVIYWLTWLLTPLVRIYEWLSDRIIHILPRKYREREPVYVSEDQIKLLVELAEQHGLFDREEGQMIKRIFAYDDLVARQVMIPRAAVIAFEVDTPLREVRESIARERHSRYPVYEGDPDNVIGLLQAKDLLRYGENAPSGILRTLLRPVYFTPTVKPINELLRELQRAKKHMAIVVDEYGSMAGIITLEDIIEQIVGEIHDEYDEAEEPIRQVGPRDYLVRSDTEISTLNERFGLTLQGAEAVTIGGIVLEYLKAIPRPGQSLAIDGLKMTVEKATPREILTLRLTLPAATAELSRHQN
jgi:CBS domain containing-hemolysin-like protein